jgi:patatin-like phospholipase/acyl hydrolase
MRVLAIDGGGIRGLIPALVLAELERRAGRRVFELFDLIAGTSTGGTSPARCALPTRCPRRRS